MSNGLFPPTPSHPSPPFQNPTPTQFYIPPMKPWHRCLAEPSSRCLPRRSFWMRPVAVAGAAAAAAPAAIVRRRGKRGGGGLAVGGGLCRRHGQDARRYAWSVTCYWQAMFFWMSTYSEKSEITKFTDLCLFVYGRSA
jgi:hypothetical protein